MTEDFTKDEGGYDLVFDAVGKSRFPICKHLLNEGGVYISSELGKRAENIYLPLLTKWSSRKVKFPLPTNPKRSLQYMQKLIERGQFDPVIDRSYKMSEVQEAFKYVMTGVKTGNVIIRIS